MIKEEDKAEMEAPPPPPETAIAIVSGKRPVEEGEHIPLVLRTLQELKQENEVVRSRVAI